MSLTDSVTQQVDKRTYLLLLGQAIKFCKALSKARYTSFPRLALLSVSALNADMSLSCTISWQENLPSAAWLGCHCKALNMYTLTFFFFFLLFLALQHCQEQKHVPMPSAWDADMLPNHTISRFKSSLTFCCFIGLQSSVQSQEHKLSPL